MDYSIYPMSIAHYTQAIKLWQSLPGMGLSGADSKDHITEFLRKNPTTCFIAQKGDRLVGTILGGSDSRRGYIYHLAVDNSEQGEGIGKKLVDTCLAQFNKNGIQKCHILVISDNKNGIAFWEHIGWHTREDVMLMSKEII
jgi:N-acetylglutamate synthase